MRARDALAVTSLNHVERILLGILADHDLEKFDPSLSVLAVNLYGRDDRKARENTRRTLKRLEDAGWVKRVPQVTARGQQTWNSYELTTPPVTGGPPGQGGTPTTGTDTPRDRDGGPPRQGGTSPLTTGGPKDKVRPNEDQMKNKPLFQGEAEEVTERGSLENLKRLARSR